MATIAEIRAQYPQYDDLSDMDLADRLHAKFYADLPKDEFYQRAGVTPAAPMPKPYPEATTGQRIASPLVKIATNTLGLPGTALQLLSEVQPPDLSDFVAPEGYRSRDLIRAAGEYVGPANLEKPFRSAGIIPPNPDYQHPETTGRVLDTITEYVGGAMLPGIFGKAAGALKMRPSNAPPVTDAARDAVVGVSAGVPAAAAREMFPDSPLVEAISGMFGAFSPAGARTVADTISGWTSRFFKGGQEQRAGKVISDAAKANPEGQTAVYERMEDAYKNVPEGQPTRTEGVAPTTGTITGDERLLQLEKGVSTDPRYRERVRQNERAISENVDQTLTPAPGATPEAATDAFRARATGAERKTAARVAGAEDELAAREAESVANLKAMEERAASYRSAAEADLAAERRPIEEMAPDTVRARAGGQTREQILAAKEADDAAIRDAYSKVDGSLPADFTNTRSAAAAAAREYGETGTPHPLLAKLAAERQEKTFRNLEADLKNVNQAIREADAAGRANDARILGLAKDGINKDLDALGANNEALRAANQQYREVISPKYKQGASADVLKAGKGGAESAVAPSDTVDRYMRTPEEAKRLKSIIGEDTAPVREWFVNDLARGAPKAGLDAAYIDRWMNRNAGQLAEFPAIRSEIARMRNRIDAKSGTVQKIDEDVKAAIERTKAQGEAATAAAKADLKTAEGAQKQVTSALAKDPAFKFIDGDPDAAVAEALKDPRAMQKLRVAAHKHGGEKAVEGLRAAVKEHVNREIRNVGSMTRSGNAPDAPQPADFKVSLAKANKLLASGSPTRAAMERVFTSDEMTALDRHRKQLEIMSRASEKGISGSNTAELLKAAGDAKGMDEALLAAQGNIQGNVIRRVFHFVEKNFLGDPQGKVNELLLDAILDPKLARTLAMKYDMNTAPVIERQLSVYLTQAGTAGGNADRKREETPK
jgi:hypothetical protein